VPFDLQDTAVNLFNRNTNLDKTFIQSLSSTSCPCVLDRHQRWALYADPNDCRRSRSAPRRPAGARAVRPGQSERRLEFTNDKLTYKIRHIYGGNVLDFRGSTKRSCDARGQSTEDRYQSGAYGRQGMPARLRFWPASASGGAMMRLFKRYAALRSSCWLPACLAGSVEDRHVAQAATRTSWSAPRHVVCRSNQRPVHRDDHRGHQVHDAVPASCSACRPPRESPAHHPTLTVDVKQGGTTVLSAPIAVTAGTVAEGTITTAQFTTRRPSPST